MSQSAQITRKYLLNGDLLEQTESVAAGLVTVVDEEIPDSSTDLLIVDFTLDYSQAKFIYIESDQDLTLETNNATTPDDTISLVANVPLLWTSTGYLTNPFTVDVTALYVTNASGAAAALKMRVGTDPTP